MKNSVLLIVALFLMFSESGFGEESATISGFNDYANSSENPLKDSFNKKINQNRVTNNNTKENFNETDSKPALQGVPVKWKACTIDSDCTAGTVDCVTWEGLNKKNLNKLSKNLNSCSGSIDPGFQPETVCVNKACQTTQKTTNVSWEEWLNKMRQARK